MNYCDVLPKFLNVRALAVRFCPFTFSSPLYVSSFLLFKCRSHASVAQTIAARREDCLETKSKSLESNSMNPEKLQVMESMQMA